MLTPKGNKQFDPFEHHHQPEEPVVVDTTLGYEGTDVKVSGIVVFLTALGIFVIVTAVLCVGIGKVINSELAKADGPVTKWNHPVDPRKLGNLAPSPELQQEFAKSVNRFPSPRLQTDDGYQEIADMHLKEDLLLENYSSVGSEAGAAGGKGAVRIPIERAMALIAQRGLPVAAATTDADQTKLAEAVAPVVKAPLTNGFARTGYEQDQTEKNTSVEDKP
jgi:hypothetical protein